MISVLFWNVAGILLLMVPGWLFRRRGILTEGATVALARLGVAAVYPCLMFATVSERYTLQSLAASWYLPAGVAGIMAVGWLLGRGASLILSFPDAAQRRAFHLQCTLNNYCFLPLPMVAQLFGPDAAAMLLFSSAGAELMVWTFGVGTLTGGRLSWDHARHLLSPPLLGLAAAIAVLILRDTGHLPGWTGPVPDGTAGKTLFATLKLLGQATIPLSMTVAGSCLAVLPLKELRNSRVWAASGMRLIVIPAVILAALACLPLPDLPRRVLCIVAVMPSAIATLSLTQVYGGDEHFTAGAVLLTHLGALVTAPALLAIALA